MQTSSALPALLSPGRPSPSTFRGPVPCPHLAILCHFSQWLRGSVAAWSLQLCAVVESMTFAILQAFPPCGSELIWLCRCCLSFNQVPWHVNLAPCAGTPSGDDTVMVPH